MVGTASLYIVDAEILVLRGMSATSETKIIGFKTEHCPCLLYTSDAADEEDSVDLGGRRIIKKKKQ